MPRISVVVPVHNVESYVATSLQSLARQTFTDLEVIMVDDGSTDASGEIAARFAARDRRFRLIRQDNRGLGNARNTGVDAASGEFLAFADSDDVVPNAAYASLVAALDSSGSDFASGNVHRLTRQGTSQAQFLARTFARTRLRTHVTRFRPLLADRTAWNKLWRRSFWDEHRLRFPEGVVHEDIPVTLPAHLMARRVDVVSAPVYQWRLREDGAKSITQRRGELRLLRDRLAAIAQVREHFAAHGPPRLARWYDASLVADDLRLHLNVFDEADDAYRQLFMDGVMPLLGDASTRTFARLPAVDRLKWHLVRRGLVDELIEVLRFQKTHGPDLPTTRRLGRTYAALPCCTDPDLVVPRSVYRLRRSDQESALHVELTDACSRGSVLTVSGRARVNGAAFAMPARQRTSLVALAPGRLQALRMRTTGRRVRAIPAPEHGSGGFEAVVDPRALDTREQWSDGTWKLFAHTRAGGAFRWRGRFELASPALIGAIDLAAPVDVCARAIVTADGGIAVDVTRRWARLRSHSLTWETELEVAIEIGGEPPPRPEVRLRRVSDGLVHTYAAQTDGHCRTGPLLRAAIPLIELRDAPPSLAAWACGMTGAPETWEISIFGAGVGLAVRLPEHLEGPADGRADHGAELARSRRGEANLVTRAIDPAASELEWRRLTRRSASPTEPLGSPTAWPL